MIYRIFLLLMIFTVGAAAQSNRARQTSPGGKTVAENASDEEIGAAQMYAEADAYAKRKFAEFEQKKIAYNSSLYEQTLREQKQLAARYAAVLAARQNLTGDDVYYFGMLHWLAKNSDGANENLKKYLAAENTNAEKVQSARAALVRIAAGKKDFAAAENFLADYLKGDPTNLRERFQLENELAENYRAAKEFAKAAAHGEEAYRAAKTLFAGTTSQMRALTEILDAAIQIFDVYKESGEPQKAEATLEDLRKTAALVSSTTVYYYAVDELIKFQIETGRKPLALETYKNSVARAAKDFAAKNLQDDVIRRLQKRERQYQLLGEIAPELERVDRWLPGEAKTLAALRGKVVLLDFWATWCGPCIAAFPALTEMQETFRKDGFEILGLTRYYGEPMGYKTPADEYDFLKDFKTKQRLPYDFVVSKDQANQINYGAFSLPTTVLIDRKGIIRYIDSGTSANREEELRKTIEKLVAEK